MKAEELAQLREKYIGKLVYVIITDDIHPIASKGRVEHVDDMGQLHGTWGSLAAIPGVDHIELL